MITRREFGQGLAAMALVPATTDIVGRTNEYRPFFWRDIYQTSIPSLIEDANHVMGYVFRRATSDWREFATITHEPISLAPQLSADMSTFIDAPEGLLTTRFAKSWTCNSEDFFRQCRQAALGCARAVNRRYYDTINGKPHGCVEVVYYGDSVPTIVSMMRCGDELKVVAYCDVAMVLGFEIKRYSLAWINGN